MADQELPTVIRKAKKLVLESIRLLSLKGNLQIVKKKTDKGPAWVLTITIAESGFPKETDAAEVTSGSFRSMKAQGLRQRG